MWILKDLCTYVPVYHVLGWPGSSFRCHGKPTPTFWPMQYTDAVLFLTDDPESLPQTVLQNVRVDVLVCEHREGREQCYCKEKEQVRRGKCWFAERLLGFLKIKSYRIFLF